MEIAVFAWYAFWKSEISLENVENFKEKLEKSIEDAQYCYKITRASQSTYSSIKCRVPIAKVEERILLNWSFFMDARTKPQDFDSLSARRFRPFLILKLIGKNALKHEFPEYIKIYPVVHATYTITYEEQAEIPASVQPRIQSVQGEEVEE